MSTTRTTILVASTDPTTRGELSSTLGAVDGWSVHYSDDGPGTIQACRDVSPALVLLDQALDRGGEEVCRAVRQLPGARQAAIVVLGREGQTSGLEELLAAGADDYLELPCADQLLLHRLERALRDPVLRGTGAGRDEACAGRVLEEVEQAFLRREDPDPVALLLVSTSLSGRPGGHEPDEVAREAYSDEVIVMLDEALACFQGSYRGTSSTMALRVYPHGSGRFLVLAEGLERVEDAARLATALQEGLGGPVDQGAGEFLSVVNVGISSSPSDTQDAAELVRHAETACYCSRQEGGSNVQYYTESMSRWAFERITLERSLRDAIDREELEVYYQPRVAIADRRVIGFEALVRWNHPELGLVSPGQFIPLAEETGLIVPIGEWVLRTACEQAARWQSQGFDPVRVSVNLSAAQFREPGLEGVVGSVLEETGLAPSMLELEVTESMLMTDAERTVEILQRLKAMGIHLSIDDFGTGYSSLSYLKRFPIDALKIDRSFVREVTTNPDDAAIATSIILMGHSLRLSVVAEGVEEERQLSFLQVLQCNEAQGFLFSPPVPAAQAEAFLSKAEAA